MKANNKLLLECLLFSYFNEMALPEIIDSNKLKVAVSKLKDFYKSYDLIHNTNHVELLTEIFSNNANKKIAVISGIGIRTLYRYKQDYLTVFDYFLMQ